MHLLSFCKFLEKENPTNRASTLSCLETCAEELKSIGSFSPDVDVKGVKLLDPRKASIELDSISEKVRNRLLELGREQNDDAIDAMFTLADQRDKLYRDMLPEVTTALKSANEKLEKPEDAVGQSDEIHDKAKTAANLFAIKLQTFMAQQKAYRKTQVVAIEGEALSPHGSPKLHRQASQDHHYGPQMMDLFKENCRNLHEMWQKWTAAVVAEKKAANIACETPEPGYMHAWHQAGSQRLQLSMDFVSTLSKIERDCQRLASAIKHGVESASKKCELNRIEVTRSVVDSCQSLSRRRDSLQALTNRLEKFLEAEKECKVWEDLQYNYDDKRKALEKEEKELETTMREAQRRRRGGGTTAHQERKKKIREELKELKSSKHVRLAACKLLELSKLRPELVWKHEQLDPFHGTAVQGWRVRRWDEYEEVRSLLDKDHVKNKKGIPKLFSAVAYDKSPKSHSRKPSRRRISPKRKVSPPRPKKTIADKIKQFENPILLDINKLKKSGVTGDMQIIRALKAKGYSTSAIMSNLQKSVSAVRSKSPLKKETKGEGIPCVLKRYEGGIRGFRSLRRSVHVMAKLQHPNVVPLQAICKDNNGAWLLQLPLFRNDLRDWAKQREGLMDTKSPSGRKLSIVGETPQEAWTKRCARMLRGVLEGLHFLHQMGVIHCDLKPENIFVGPPVKQKKKGGTQADEEGGVSTVDEYAVIADFETCKVSIGSDNGHITTTTKTRGTWGYIDPEVSNGSALASSASDMYAFGVTMGEMLIGKRLGTPSEVMREISFTDEQKRIITALVDPRGSMRPSALDLLQMPFFAGGAMALRRCWNCGGRKASSEGVECSNPNGHHHFTCNGCFDTYVKSQCSDEVRNIIKRSGRIRCPLSHGSGGKDASRCESPAIPDLCVALHTSEEVFDLLLQTRADVARMKMKSDLEHKHQKRLRKELEAYRKLDARKRRIREAKAHIEANILTTIDGVLVDLCPRSNCRQPFLGFDGCFAITCSHCGCGIFLQIT